MNISLCLRASTLALVADGGILMVVGFDQNGDLNRERNMTKTENIQQVVSAILSAVAAP